MNQPAPTGSDQPSADAREERIREAVDAGFPTTVAELSRLVRIPSVAWAGFDHAHVAASADAVAELLRGLDVFDTVEIARAPVEGSSELGQPAVLARRAARNGRPTVLLYAHHDVQPPGEDSEWDSPPFEPTARGDRLYGRGAADDKAGVMAHVAAIRALVAANPEFDLGVALFIEGEEEDGSRSFANFLELHREALAADAIVVADSTNWDAETPALTVALRGNVTCRVTVSTLAHASHSGMYGGAVPDAMMAMVRLLASLHDDEGAVAVDGLRSIDMETPPYDEAQLRAEAGLLDGVAPVGRGTILQRLWAQPAITVTGTSAPRLVDASNTLSPSVTMKLSVRVAPGQTAADAAAAIERHLRANAPFGAHVDIDDVVTGDPFLVDTDGWAVDAVLDAMRDAWPNAPIQTGIGGSIPFIADLTRVFPEAQILVTGVEDPDSRAHSPNESLHLGAFKRSVLTEALFLARLDLRGA
ncbi:dipeptidase [Agromyces rhizosphaerae]|uniref:Dipeptidase n=1 Tax=Agromyces rhizosphaerae TaxID=88374 RepID=A0A9W6FQX1_9MICO|nr:dipeptidase [Agromyces rhizosphaerae]GLI28965.1 dipeptidase [Agromyces rhizosphaerae]